jgi:hypothetical protein
MKKLQNIRLLLKRIKCVFKRSKAVLKLFYIVGVFLRAAVNILQNHSEILSFTIKSVCVCASQKLRVQNYQRLT